MTPKETAVVPAKSGGEDEIADRNLMTFTKIALVRVPMA